MRVRREVRRSTGFNTVTDLAQASPFLLSHVPFLLGVRCGACRGRCLLQSQGRRPQPRRFLIRNGDKRSEVKRVRYSQVRTLEGGMHSTSNRHSETIVCTLVIEL